MKIILTTYCFYPENTPIAHQTYALAKEFTRKGHRVTIYVPDYNYDYAHMEKQYNLIIRKVHTGFFLNINKKFILSAIEEPLSALKEPFISNEKTKDTRKFSVNEKDFFHKAKRLLIAFANKFLNILFPNGKTFEYAFMLRKALLKNNLKSDMIISFSAPFPVHIGVAAALKRKTHLAKMSIAVCSDLFFHAPATPKTFYFKMIEKNVLQRFDYITVPDPQNIYTFLDYKSKDKIKVIPYGYDFTSVKRAVYNPTKIPTFAFAGTFIKKFKNPTVLLEHLSQLQTPFKFLIYLRLPKMDILHILWYYKKKLSDRLIIYPPLPRLKCIYQLSKCDFLINMQYITPYPPSYKIIDYALADRPIFNFSQNNFDKEVFDQFLKGDYSKQLKVDLNDHKIENVCDKFIELYNEKND